jgi:prepilin-type N-terminal cleavage/methylation domain-containing protein
MDKLKTKIRNVFKGSKTKKGFSLMELIVVIAIMVIMLAVLAPSLIHYVEDTRAKKDTSASSEMTNAVTMGLTNQDVYDELIKNSVKGNVSCYIDSPTEEGYEKIESSSKYTFDNNARLLDEVPYHPAGNMYGMTITFEPKQKSNGSDTEYSLKDGIVNKYVPEKTQLLTENENLYAALRKVVGEKVELNSQTYRNSELTIFVQVGSRKGSDIITTDAVEVYSQFSGTNLPADTEIEYIPTTDRVIDYVYNDPDEPIGGGTGGSGTLPDGGGSGTTGGNTEHTHSYEKQVTSPTCQNQGYTTYVCTCGDSYVDEESYVDKVGHSYTSTIEKYATCTATGIKSLKCSICGNTETAEIAKLGHDYKDDVIQATCTTNG